MKKPFEKALNISLIVTTVVLITVIIVTTALSSNQKKQEETLISTYKTIATTTKPTEVVVQAEEVTIYKNKTKNNSTTEATETATESTTESSTEEETEVTFATPETQEATASYQEQWDKGYLLALDYPDENYNCPHVELSDENRALIESICMGEFGSGGFTGAALIAQSLKNAMVYYGTDNVESILDDLHYTGRRNYNTSKDVRDAVVYVFDMDKDAVQHRIFYKYNPETRGSLSEFHESKEYVCTYREARFFDE